MKKMLFCALAAVVLAGCAKETEIESQVSGDTFAAADTRAAVAELTQGWNDYLWGYSSLCLNAEGDLYAIYCKGDWGKKEDTSNYGYKYSYILPEHFHNERLVRSACVDIYDSTYFITPENKLIKVVVNYDIIRDFYYFMNNPAVMIDNCYYGLDIVDLTSSLPDNLVFLRLTAADNGNVFVTTGKKSDGDYGAIFPNHTVYRISATGKATEIATINMSVTATLVSNWVGNNISMVEGWRPSIEAMEYPSILSKAKGSVLYGLDADGNGYKVSTTTGAVEYFTPRVPVKCMAAALNGNNPYVISGNSIIEVRPNLAKDIVVGTIPADVAAKAHTLLVDADATTFYIGVKKENEYSTVYKFTR